MVSPQATQPDKPSHPTDWPQQRGDSPRITAEVRRQVLREHYRAEQVHQASLTKDFEWDLAALSSADPNALRAGQLQDAKNRVLVSKGIEQHIAANLAAFGNRDFVGQVNQ